MLELIRRELAGRRVLVTGHTGFKGGWLCLWLQHLGAEVHGLALPPPTEPNLYTLAGLEGSLASIIADIRDAAAVEAALAQSRPEVLFHLAAQPLVRLSYAEPLATYATNVMGTAHVLEAVRRVGGVRAVVVVSSDKCYDNVPGRMPVEGFAEDAPMGGADPYSSSKGCTELVAASWRASYFAPAAHAQHGVALASARAGNVIGGGDWAADRLVPDLVRAFEAGRPASIRHPAAVRPWQHVLEPLWGYLLLAARLLAEGPRHAKGWNFGPDAADTLTVGELADTLCRLWGEGASWQAEAAAAPLHEAPALRLDATRAREGLGWRPLCRLPEALARSAAWYRAAGRGADLRAACMAEIARHEDAIAALGTS